MYSHNCLKLPLSSWFAGMRLFSIFRFRQYQSNPRRFSFQVSQQEPVVHPHPSKNNDSKKTQETALCLLKMILDVTWSWWGCKITKRNKCNIFSKSPMRKKNHFHKKIPYPRCLNHWIQETTHTADSQHPEHSLLLMEKWKKNISFPNIRMPQPPPMYHTPGNFDHQTVMLNSASW